MRFFVIFIQSFVVLVATAWASDGPFEYQFEEVADGVWTGVRDDSPRFPVMGNATFVIGDDGVIVFDGGGVPAMADQIIDKIKSLTDAPVTHVVISHWHGDHNFGVYRFAEEFPAVEFVAHKFTAAAMDSAKIDYILRLPTFYERNLPEFEKVLETGIDFDGAELNEIDRMIYERMIADAEIIDSEYKKVKLTMPTKSFDDQMVIDRGDRKVELLFLGHGNTEGDIVMWLPDEKVVATGDLVVHPTPYAFNVPPRAWAATLSKLNNLGYEKLVPGHGAIQLDANYVNLIIEASTSIADQRDKMVEEGLTHEEIRERLDFSAFDQRFTGGDAYVVSHYDAWFVGPLRAAATKELTGEPMVALEPRATATDEAND